MKCLPSSLLLSVTMLLLITTTLQVVAFSPARIIVSTTKRRHATGFSMSDPLLSANQPELLVISSLKGRMKTLSDNDNKDKTQPPAYLDNNALMRKENQKQPTFQKWMRRLVTREDFLHLHKVSNLAFVVSTTRIMAHGIASGFHDFPLWFEPWMNVFFASSVVCYFSSLQMAATHRRASLEIQQVFELTGFSNLYSCIVSIWLAPFAPNFIHGEIFGYALFGFLFVHLMKGTIQSMMNVDVLMKSRRDKSNWTHMSPQEEQIRDVIHVFGYMSPLWLGIPLFGYSLWAFGIHGYDWFMDAVANDSLPFLPHVDLVRTEYALITASIAASYAALCVTLRDKKLISAEMELFWIILLAVVSQSFLVNAFGFL